MTKGVNNFSSLLRGNIQHTAGVNIRLGQILYGTVLEVSADRAVLLLQGLNVMAELKTEMTPGERVALQVKELNPMGQILLKKLAGEENKPTIEQQELRAALHHFGLPPGKLNQSILSQLFQGGLPLSQQHLRYLIGFAAKNNLSPDRPLRCSGCGPKTCR